MTEAATMLKIIETVNPADTAKLDEMTFSCIFG
jgi:hypothetical protein